MTTARLAALRVRLAELEAADASDQTSVEWHEYQQVRRAIAALEGRTERRLVAFSHEGTAFKAFPEIGSYLGVWNGDGCSTTLGQRVLQQVPMNADGSPDMVEEPDETEAESEARERFEAADRSFDAGEFSDAHRASPPMRRVPNIVDVEYWEEGPLPLSVVNAELGSTFQLKDFL